MGAGPGGASGVSLLYCTLAPRLLLLWDTRLLPTSQCRLRGLGGGKAQTSGLFPPCLGLGLAWPCPVPSSAELPVGHRPLGHVGGPHTSRTRNCLRRQRSWGHGPHHDGCQGSPTPWILINTRSLLSGQMDWGSGPGRGSPSEGASKGRVWAGRLGAQAGSGPEKGTGKASSPGGGQCCPSALGGGLGGPSGQCLTSSLRLPRPTGPAQTLPWGVLGLRKPRHEAPPARDTRPWAQPEGFRAESGEHPEDGERGPTGGGGGSRM